jgi:diacylglycerol O-acyltransferase / wax synthase
METVMGRERMSTVDTAWLRMDSPTNLMMIVGVHVFETPISYEKLRDVVTLRLLQYRRFRQKVVTDATGSWWVDDGHFDLGQHLHRVSLPGKGDKAELEKYVGALSTESLDPTRPLWQFHLVENYGRGNALVARIHHCIADGIALIGVMLSMTAPTAEASLKTPDTPTWIKTRKSSDNANVWEDFFAPVTQVAVKAINATSGAAARAIGQTGGILQHPEAAVSMMSSKAMDFAQVAAHVAKDAAEIALMQSDTPTSLKGKPGRAKMVSWNEPLPLDEVKAVGKALGCSVNDVLLSCVAGAIRGYLIAQGDKIAPDAELRAMVPVNLRPAGKEHQLGNRFGLVPLTLPIGIGNPLARLYEVRRRMGELKGGYQAVLAMALLGMVGAVPRSIQSMVLNMLSSKATAVMTNVPGPTQPLYMAGAKMTQVMFWVPQSGDVGLGVSILSYGGGVQFGVITSKKLCAHPSQIIARFEPEFEKLILAAMMVGPDLALDPQKAEFELFPELKLIAQALEDDAAREEQMAAAAKSNAGTKGAAMGAVVKPSQAAAKSGKPVPAKVRESAVQALAPVRKKSRFAQLRHAA